MHRRDADTAAYADDAAAGTGDVGGTAERTEDGGKRIAFAELSELQRGRADGLEDDGDCAALRIGIGDGERNALAPVGVDHQDDELPSLAVACDQRRLEVHPVHVFGQLALLKDFVHRICCCVFVDGEKRNSGVGGSTNTKIPPAPQMDMRPIRCPERPSRQRPW